MRPDWKVLRDDRQSETVMLSRLGDAFARLKVNLSKEETDSRNIEKLLASGAVHNFQRDHRKHYEHAGRR
jgi:hypothetical protein